MCGSTFGRRRDCSTVSGFTALSLTLPAFVSLKVVKTGGTPKVPDCFQRTPKKLCIPEKAEILAVNVDSKGMSCQQTTLLFPLTYNYLFFQHPKRPKKSVGTLKSCVAPGVHAVLKTGSWVRYCIFDLATGKAEQENNFPTSNLAFLGQSERNVGIFTAGQVSRTSSVALTHSE